MSACFKLIAVLAILVCFYCQESNASKDWIKDRINDVQQITKKFNKESLIKFLKSGPKLWVEATLTKAREMLLRNSVKSVKLSQAELDALVAKSANNTANMKNHAFSTELPTQFDAREKWPNCASIAEIADQSGCGGCWAVATTNAMSDRVCIATYGTKQPRISTMDVMECCTKCKGNPMNGCDGGIHHYVYEYYAERGIVTGGAFGAKDCKPYQWGTNSKDSFRTGQCLAQCKNGADYEKSKHYGFGMNAIMPNNPVAMQRELMNNGPLTVGIDIYEDFVRYKSGIYYKKWESGRNLGGHSVRLIGWGEENGIPYWLVANSWNKSWGENGLFRVVRGKNEIGIESAAVAGMYNSFKSKDALV